MSAIHIFVLFGLFLVILVGIMYLFIRVYIHKHCCDYDGVTEYDLEEYTKNQSEINKDRL